MENLQTGQLKLSTVWLFLPHSLFVIMCSLELHIWDKPDTWYRKGCFINWQDWKCNRQAVKLTDSPVARWMKSGSVTRVSNGCRNIKYAWHFTDSPRQAWKLQLTITDYVNIGPDSPKKTLLPTNWLQWNTRIRAVALKAFLYVGLTWKTTKKSIQ